MKMTKKLTAYLVSAILAVSMMTGCSEDEKATPKPLGIGEQTSEAVTDNSEATTTTSVSEPDDETTTTTTTSEETTTTTTTEETTTTTTTEETTTTSESTTTSASETTAGTSASKQGTTTKLSSVIPDITVSVNAQFNEAFRTQYDSNLKVAKDYSWYVHKEKVLVNTATEYGVYVCYAIKKSAIQTTVLPGVYKVKMVNGKPNVTFYQVTGAKNDTIAAYEKYTVSRSSSMMQTVFRSYGKYVGGQTTTKQ